MRQLKISQSITNRDDRSFQRYLHEVSLMSMVTAQEEVELAQKIKQGDEAALKRLINANLRFVISVAKQYQNQGMTLNDIINEGNFGLIKAAKRFDETKGFKFISYAVWWVRQSILQALAEQARGVRLPLNQVASLSKISKAESRFEQSHEREPTPEELAEILDVSADKILDAKHHAGRQKSLDAPFEEGEENSLLDVLPYDEAATDSIVMKQSLNTEIERLLSHLEEGKAKTIIIHFFGLFNNEAKSMDEIGEMQSIRLTRERVRQIKERTLTSLLKHAERQRLQEYLQ
jgi:RNA polymerase primary sigma factor